MGEEGKKVLTQITKPYDLMSVDTTQPMWRGVTELSNEKLKKKYNLALNPSNWKGDTLPVEKVSHDDVSQLWLRALNELSNLDDADVQHRLQELFPGHTKGSAYGLPTEAQWEYAIQNLGLAEGLAYSRGNSEESLSRP